MKEIVYYMIHRELASYKGEPKHQYFLLDKNLSVVLKGLTKGNVNHNYALAFDWLEEQKLPIEPVYPGYSGCNVVLIDLPKVTKDKPLDSIVIEHKIEQYKLKQKTRDSLAKLKKIEADFN